MHNQRGVSLLSLVFVGIAAVLFLVYGSALIGIPYTSYKVGNIMKGIVKEGTTKDSDIKRVFNERVRFEGIGNIVSAENLTISQEGSTPKLTAEYEHCEALWKNWTVCAQITTTR